MMQGKEDFFAPGVVDERLELSLLQRNVADYQDMTEADPNLLLIYDLRYLYGAEGTENVRSLQRVWERLARQRAGEPITASFIPAEMERRLRLLEPSQKQMPGRRKNRRVHGRTLAALAAMLFLVIVVGSLFTIVHLTRSVQADGNSATASTPVQATTAASQPAPIPGYPYPAPGKDIALSPFSADHFYALAWSPDGKHLAVSMQGSVWIWDLASGQYRALLKALPAGSNVKALAWSPDGRYLAVGSNPIQVVDPASGNVLWSYSADYPYLSIAGQNTLVTALAWSPNGTMLATATQHTDAKCFVNIWNIQAGVSTFTFKGQGSSSGISSLSWSDDSVYVASTDAQSIQAWDVRNGYTIFQRPLTAATEVAWSPNAGLLAFVSANTTQVWDVWRPKSGPVSSYPGTTNGVLTWSPDGRYLATASGSRAILYDASNGIRLYTYTGNAHEVRFLLWSPDGNALASGEDGATGNNAVRVWSA